MTQTIGVSEMLLCNRDSQYTSLTHFLKKQYIRALTWKLTLFRGHARNSVAIQWSSHVLVVYWAPEDSHSPIFVLFFFNIFKNTLVFFAPSRPFLGEMHIEYLSALFEEFLGYKSVSPLLSYAFSWLSFMCRFCGPPASYKTKFVSPL